MISLESFHFSVQDRVPIIDDTSSYHTALLSQNSTITIRRQILLDNIILGSVALMFSGTTENDSIDLCYPIRHI